MIPTAGRDEQRASYRCDRVVNVFLNLGDSEQVDDTHDDEHADDEEEAERPA